MLTVYTQPGCKFCTLAMQLLTEYDIPFKTVDIKTNPTARAFLKAEGHKMVPQIYKGDVLFVEGGYEGLTGLAAEELASFPDLLSLEPTTYEVTLDE